MILSKKILQQLESMTTLSKEDATPTLAKIRSLSSWQQEWEKSAEESLLEANSTDNSDEAKCHFKKAASKFYIAHMFLNHKEEEKQRLIRKCRLAYQRYGQLEGMAFEHVRIHLDRQPIYGYFQHAGKCQKSPALLLLPHLGGTKEEIDFLSTRFIDAGFATLRLDLPGSGETPGILPLTAEKICSQAITYLCKRAEVISDKIVVMGLSFGAFWVMKTAAIDRRIKLAIGISTPAMSSKQWDAFPQHNWLAFQQCFGTKDILSTRKLVEQLTLFGVMENIQCPVLLFHGQKDKMYHPKAVEMLTQNLKVPVETRVYPKSGHCCLDKLTNDIIPFAVQWCHKILS